MKTYDLMNVAGSQQLVKSENGLLADVSQRPLRISSRSVAVKLECDFFASSKVMASVELLNPHH